MSKGNYQIPFDSKGNQLSYVDEWMIKNGRAILKDNEEFEETLTYSGYGRGRSSATIHFKDAKNNEYSMFLSDFDELMRSGKLSGNQIKAKWTFAKKGRNFGIKMVK